MPEPKKAWPDYFNAPSSPPRHCGSKCNGTSAPMCLQKSNNMQDQGLSKADTQCQCKCTAVAK